MGRSDKKASKRKMLGEEDLQMDINKEVHNNLSRTIKGLHWKLRKEFRANTDAPGSVWQRHIQDSAALQTYAKAMYTLATQHWGGDGHSSRIDWARAAALDFFCKDGLKLALEKDERRKMFQMKNVTKDRSSDKKDEEDVTTPHLVTSDRESICCTQLPYSTLHSEKWTFRKSKISSNLGAEDESQFEMPISMGHSDSEVITVSNPNNSQAEECFHQGNSNTDSRTEQKHNIGTQIICKTLPTIEPMQPSTSPCDDKIRLLDVGSCYNPFKQFPEFDSIGIDLCPANESVLQCDFLSLSVEPSSKGEVLASPLKLLPAQSFHVCVFSLLLEYLPAHGQRWQCCLTAHALLPRNGLLIVLTPDSNHVNKNAPMMKSWKQAIEAIGFRRWRYEKQTHIHCMAFRKITDSLSPLTPEDTVRLSAMLYIPQDFNDEPDLGEPRGDKKQKCQQKSVKKNEHEPCAIPEKDSLIKASTGKSTTTFS